MKDKDLGKWLHDAFTRMEEKKRKTKFQKDPEAGECLSEEAISDYLSSSLPESEKEQAEHHLSLCPHCRHILTTSMKVEALEQAESATREKHAELSKALGKKIIEGISAITETLNISLAWARGNLIMTETNADSFLSFPLKDVLRPIPVRGGSHPSEKTELPSITKMGKDYKIIINIRKEGEKSCELDCRSIPTEHEKKGAKIKAYLIQDDRILNSYPFEQDRVRLHGIIPGQYSMVIRGEEEVIAVISLKIESGVGE
ncbi:MAG: zf-HC2 domain-containing protein [bacterium]